MFFEVFVTILVALDSILYFVIALGMILPHENIPRIWPYYVKIFKSFYYECGEGSQEWELRREEDLRKDFMFKSMGHRLLAISVMRLFSSLFYTCNMIWACALTFLLDFIFMLDMMSHGEVHMKSVTKAGLEHLVQTLGLLVLFVAAKSPACH